MSKLEDLIEQCRKVWTEIGVTPEHMDEMLDSLIIDNDFFKEFPFDDYVIRVATEGWFEAKNKEQEDKRHEQESGNITE